MRVQVEEFGVATSGGIWVAAGEWLPKFYEHHAMHDVVVASRYVDQGVTENGLILVLMSRVLNLSYSLVLGIDCKDVSNSFRLYHAADLKALDLKCSNFDIVEEILVKMVRKNPHLLIKEIPFTFKQRMFGKTKRNLVAFIATYALTMIKLKFFL